jgi:hypothetical protein
MLVGLCDGTSHNPTACPHNLTLLAAATDEELRELGAHARDVLANGCWESDAAEVGEPAALAARHFMDQWPETHSLTEGLIAHYGNDLAGELRLMRGWCVHKPDPV